MEDFSTCDLITQVTNKLFVYTDLQQWDKLQHEVFTHEVLFDMSSLGGERGKVTSEKICSNWKEGFVGIDSVNHLAGNYIIDITGEMATVLAYATATHFKKLATHGKTREFVGSYDLHLVKTSMGWRIDEFTYRLKYTDGNVDFT